MSLVPISVATLWLALVSTNSPSQVHPWNVISKDGPVTILARDVPNSDIRETKLISTLPVPVTRIWDVLEDIEHYTEFMPYIQEIRRLGERKNDRWLEYQRLDPPIITDRDYILQMQIESDPASGYYYREWTCVTDEGPPPSDEAVRIELCRGSWTLNAKGANKTHVVYHVFTDPGGSLPSWLANRANAQSLRTLIDAISNRSQDPNWKR